MLVKTAFRPAYQQIYQRFLVFPNELRCTLLSLKNAQNQHFTEKAVHF